MILELGDGREIPLPDEMSDEAARQLKRLVLTCEERAATAEAQVRMLRDEMAALRAQLGAATQRFASEAQTVAAIKEMHTSLAQALRAVANVAGADRILVNDEFDRSISRVVK